MGSPHLIRSWTLSLSLRKVRATAGLHPKTSFQRQVSSDGSSMEPDWNSIGHEASCTLSQPSHHQSHGLRNVLSPFCLSFLFLEMNFIKAFPTDLSCDLKELKLGIYVLKQQHDMCSPEALDQLRKHSRKEAG